MIANIKEEIKDSVEEICMGAIIEIFSDTKDIKLIPSRTSFYTYQLPTVAGKFKKEAIKAVRKSHSDEVAKKCELAASDIVLGETFIDSVVERINKKQVSG